MIRWEKKIKKNRKNGLRLEIYCDTLQNDKINVKLLKGTLKRFEKKYLQMLTFYIKI